MALHCNLLWASLPCAVKWEGDVFLGAGGVECRDAGLRPSGLRLHPDGGPRSALVVNADPAGPSSHFLAALVHTLPWAKAQSHLAGWHRASSQRVQPC